MHSSPFLAAAVACIASACAQTPFTLEQVMSAPFPSAPAVSPSGGRIAWVYNARGVRNIWVAEPPAYRGHSVTSYAADDGQEISELQWSPDGHAIVYVRGEGANGAGEYPNPTSDPSGAEQQVWVVALEGAGDQKGPQLIGEGNQPAVSPASGHVAFVRKGQIWSAPLDGKEKAEQLIHARGQNGDLHWSPDGARLVYVSRRGNHSFVGIYDASAKTVHYLDASVDQDEAPVWSPDSRRVAFLRAPSVDEHRYFTSRRSGPPWSIRVADASGIGEGKEVWKAFEGDGSVFRELGSAQQLYWAGDRIVFPWEHDGWTHLYSVPVTGGDAALLTPGAFEVEHVAMTPDGREMIYSSNQDDIDRRHIWRVASAGGAPAELTAGRELEWSPAVTSDGAVVFLHSDAKRQARPAIRLAAGEVRDLAPDAIPADFPRDALVTPQQVIFSAADGLTLHGQLFLPADGAGQKHPAVVFFHGGSRRQMLLGWHYMYYYNNSYALNQYLASRGYVVLSVNYRSGIGYGMKFREAINYGAGGGSEFNDVMGAGLFLKNHPAVDPTRIGLWGGSYGGYLTALGLARASDLFAAGVDFHGVHDWTEELGIRKDDDFGRLAFNSSPMANAKDWRSPVLLIHGDDDRNVNFRQTVELVEALRGRVHLEQLIFPDEIHDFLLYAHWVASYQAAARFFDLQLQTNANRNGASHN
ncbi:MAG TPA: prolyl oligopeptidase family serine peptidase [Bryobacteraceae bacterium]|jgi:dipeptidyl aminopeptidase/acylaminoacyl peptidase|nr:prolyl oligopeptidase family serine peptidase [Bryobacteraceae bacterium]